MAFVKHVPELYFGNIALDIVPIVCYNGFVELKACVPAEMNPPLNTQLIVDAGGLQRVSAFLGSVTEFCLDLETNVTDGFFDRRIRTIQVGNREEQYVIDLLAFSQSSFDLYHGLGRYNPARWTFPILDALRSVLEAPSHLKIGHGLDFEYETLKWNLGVRIHGLYDTMLAEKVLYSGLIPFYQKNFWGLDDLAARYCGIQMSKTEQKSFDLETPLTDNQVIYGGLDVRIPFSIKTSQNKYIITSGLQKALQIENDCIPASGDIHLNGLLIDESKWNALLDTTRQEHQKNIDELDKHFLPLVGEAVKPYTDEQVLAVEEMWRACKWSKERRAELRADFTEMRKQNTTFKARSSKFEGKAAIHYGSSAQLKEALNDNGYKLPSTNDEVLEMFEGDPIIDAIRAYRTTLKVLDSYGEYLNKYVNKNTGRIHSNFNQLGADTGRASSSNPNMQNINRESAWRSCFVARKGYKIITIDYNGCELRILAECSGEKAWVDAFNAGWDVHSVGAEIIFPEEWLAGAEEGCAYYAKHAKCKCKVHKILRDQIKAINFGIAYGMEAGKLGRGIKKTKQEAQKLLDKYKRAFPQVTEWLRKIGIAAKTELKSRTLSGRHRLYARPDWDKAKEIASVRCEADGKVLNAYQINRVYQSMYATIERAGKNSPIQGTNADMIKLAIGCGTYQCTEDGLGYMATALEQVYGAFLVNVVHDECVIEAPEEIAEEVKRFAEECMIRAGSEFLKTVVAECEGGISDCWSKG